MYTTLLAPREGASRNLVSAAYTVKEGEAAMEHQLLQQVLTRIEKMQEEVAMATEKRNTHGLVKVCASLLAGRKAFGGRLSEGREAGVGGGVSVDLASNEREATRVQELRDLLLALDG